MIRKHRQTQTRLWDHHLITVQCFPSPTQLLNHLPGHGLSAQQNHQSVLDSKQKGPYRQVDTDIRAIQQRHSASDNGRGISSCRDVCLCTLGFPEPSFLSMLTSRAPAQSPPQETQHDCALMWSNLWEMIREECEFPHLHIHVSYTGLE